MICLADTPWPRYRAGGPIPRLNKSWEPNVSTSKGVPTRARVAELRVLKVLNHYARVCPSTESGGTELIKSLKAGDQPYPVVLAGTTVLFGADLVAAAEAAGVAEVRAVRRPGCDGLGDALLAIEAAGLYLAAERERGPADAFELGLTAGKMYSYWAEWSRGLGIRPAARMTAKEREAARSALFAEAFGRKQRTLERDYVLSTLSLPLREAVRDGRLPVSRVEDAARMTGDQKEALADLLAGG